MCGGKGAFKGQLELQHWLCALRLLAWFFYCSLLATANEPFVAGGAETRTARISHSVEIQLQCNVYYK